jgi:hypothetical protein
MINKYSLLVLSSFPLFANVEAIAQKAWFQQRAFPIVTHDHANQLSLSLGWEKGFDLSSSFSLSKHVFLFGSAALNKRLAVRSTILDMIYIKMNDRYFVSGFGYFGKLQTKYIRKINLYAAFSATRVRNHWAFVEQGVPDDFFSAFTKAHYHCFYLGGDAVYEDKRSDYAWTFRFCNYGYDQLEFHNGDMTNTSSEPISSVKNLTGNNLEMYLSAGYKWKQLKASVQFGFSIPVKQAYCLQTDTLHVGPNIFVSSHQEDLRGASFISKLSVQYSFDLSPQKTNK